jgi:hypothetical protein
MVHSIGPKSAKRFSDKPMRREKHRPEKCQAVFGQADAQRKASARKVPSGFRTSRCAEKSNGPKSAKRFSDKPMRREKHRPEKCEAVFG